MESPELETNPNHLTADQERVILDAKIHELEVTLVTLKRRRNALSPISKVPADVLFQIFRFFREGDIELLRPFQRTPLGVKLENRLEMAWIRALTHICSTWRYVALDSPFLWSRLSLNLRKDPIAMILNRSGSRPLTLSLMYLGDTDDTSDNLDLVMTQPDRVKHLELGFTYSLYSWISTKMDLLTKATLESCSLTASPGTSSYIKFSAIIFPLRMLQASSNTLRHLQLSRCTLDFWTIRQPQPLPFPNLSVLEVHGLTCDVIDLLAHISFPRTCTVTLDVFKYVGAESPRWHTLGPFIERIWGTPGTPTTNPYFSTFTIKKNTRDVTSLCLAINDSKSDAQNANATDNLIIKLPALNSINSLNWLSTLPLPYVQTLRAEFPLDPYLWKTLKERCHNITSLSLKEMELAILKWILYMDDTRTHDSDPTSSSPGPSLQLELEPSENHNIPHLPPFPKLEHLEVISPDFDSTSHLALLDCIQQRHELDIPIKRLALQKVTGTTAYIQEFTPYVHGEAICNVLDDGFGGMFDSEDEDSEAGQET